MSSDKDGFTESAGRSGGSGGQSSNSNNGQSASNNSSASSSGNKSGGGKSGNNRNNNNNNKGNGKSSKFTGETNSLKDAVITEFDPQYKRFKEKIVHYTTTTYNGKVISAIDDLKPKSIKDFVPTQYSINKKDYMVPQRDKKNMIMVDKHGKPIMIEDAMLKRTLESMTEYAVKDAHRSLVIYNQGMEDMYTVIIGQVNKTMKERLKGFSQFRTIKRDKDAIGLMTIIRELYYQNNKSTVHGITNIIRALQKLITCQQDNKSTIADKYPQGAKRSHDECALQRGNCTDRHGWRSWRLWHGLVLQRRNCQRDLPCFGQQQIPRYS